MCRLISIPAEMPAEVMILPCSTKITFSRTSVWGAAARRAAMSSQCVVAAMPSSSPAFASRNAPVQTEAVMTLV